MAKLLAAALVALLVYGCASSQLARSQRVQPCGGPPVAEAEPRGILRDDTRAEIRATVAQLRALDERAQREAGKAP